MTDSDSSSQEGETPDNSSEYSSDEDVLCPNCGEHNDGVWVNCDLCNRWFTLPVLVYQMAISVALNGTAPLVIQTSNCRKKCLLQVLLCPLCRYVSNIVQQLKTLSMASPIRRKPDLGYRTVFIDALIARSI